MADRWKKKSYPEKPKSSATVAQMKAWMKRCNTIDAYNCKIDKEKKEHASLLKKVRARKRKC